MRCSDFNHVTILFISFIDSVYFKLFAFIVYISRGEQYWAAILAHFHSMVLMLCVRFAIVTHAVMSTG